MPEIELSSRLREAIGARSATRLAEKLGLDTVGQLLRYYPRRYEKRGRLTDLSSVREGEKVTVWATVRSANTRVMPKGSKVRSVTKIVIADSRKQLTCAFFNQGFLVKLLPPGTNAMFSGMVKKFNDELQLSSPQVAVLKQSGDGTTGTSDIQTIEEFPGGLIPVYPLTEGVTMQLIQSSVKAVLAVLETVPDPVPEAVLALHGLTDLDTALRNIHRPESAPKMEQAQERLRYDEALAVQLVLARRRAAARAFPAEPCPRVDTGALAAFDAALPFVLTEGQRAVGKEIAHDLSCIHPMNRLLQGEVGSGKTVVALRAMLQVIDAGRQAVLLAPTEVLAAQHARSLRDILGPFGHGGELGSPQSAVKVTLLTGSMGAKARRTALLDIVSGDAGIAVGTHALLSEGVFFSQLGLVVVDEQHRFGVEQRNVLRSRHPAGNPPHVLVMTATPIPRTVAMTVFGDLETSVLTGLPLGRAPISTTIVPAAEKPAWLERAWQRVREEVGRGHQVYVVCPRIGDDSAADADEEALDGPGQTAEGRRPPLALLEMAEQLRRGPLAGLRVSELHGRLPPADKDATMSSFARGEIDVLVATTVIEVGVDVANATMMIILDAERFGMSQLHQLRGRVGRGTAPGVCLLVTETPQHSLGWDRLASVAATNDGFALAEADLRLRREGDVLGTAQAGRSSGLKQLSLLEHRQVIEQARADATDLIGDDPMLTRWPGLADLVGAVIAAEDQEFLDKG